MKSIATIALLATAVLAAPAPAIDIFERGVCKSGFSVETFGGPGCGLPSQGITNSGKSCNTCVEMGNAASWDMLNPDHCGTVHVDYFPNANCEGSVSHSENYQTGMQACNNIPTNIGDHFSGRFVCLA